MSSALRQCRVCRASFPVVTGGEAQDECPRCRADDLVIELEDEDVSFGPKHVASAFRGEIPVGRLPWSYRLWILVVSCVMIALPLVYLGIMAAAIYVMYWHATRDITIFENVKDGRGAMLGYFGPLFALGVLVFFMAKPLFAPRRREFSGRSLEREQEPALFALVDGICESVGAPRPVRIDVDCDVNASASPEFGIFSLFRRRLVLTVGLPLVAVFNADQFAGVLAHEFGHFAQSTGMKLSYLIRSINAWFARVVYERDAWDEQLAQGTSIRSGYAMILFGLTRLIIWATRRLLWVLMHVGHAASCALLRQMEFDADRCEALLGGSAASESATRRLRVAMFARSGAMADVADRWREGRLPDNLPRLIEANIPQLPPEIVKVVDEALETERTKLFDTHPADRDRIAAVRALDAAGVFRLDGPATALFRDFDALAREATADHYLGLLGDEFKVEQLQPYRSVVAGVEGVMEARKAFGRVYAGAPCVPRPVPLPSKLPDLAIKPADARAKCEAIRAKQLATRAAHDAEVDPFIELNNKLHRIEAAALMLEAGFKVKAASYGLIAAKAGAARALADLTGREIAEQGAKLDPFDKLCAQRMALAFITLNTRGCYEEVDPDETLRDEVRSHHPIAAAMAKRVWPAASALAGARAGMAAILENFEGNEQNAKLHQAILAEGRGIHDKLEELKAALGHDLPYPFEHAKGEITLAEFAVPTVPEANDIGELLEASDRAMDHLTTVYIRLLGRLAVIVERVETFLGLPVLAIDEKSEHNRPLE